MLLSHISGLINFVLEIIWCASGRVFLLLSALHSYLYFFVEDWGLVNWPLHMSLSVDVDFVYFLFRQPCRWGSINIASLTFMRHLLSQNLVPWALAMFPPVLPQWSLNLRFMCCVVHVFPGTRLHNYILVSGLAPLWSELFMIMDHLVRNNRKGIAGKQWFKIEDGKMRGLYIV